MLYILYLHLAMRHKIGRRTGNRAERLSGWQRENDVRQRGRPSLTRSVGQTDSRRQTSLRSERRRAARPPARPPVHQRFLARSLSLSRSPFLSRLFLLHPAIWRIMGYTDDRAERPDKKYGGDSIVLLQSTTKLFA